MLRTNGLAAALLVSTAAAASAQETPPPAPPAPQPAAEPPPAPAAPRPPAPAIELGVDSIRKPDGLLVHFYRVNYVPADLLVKELERWKTPKGQISFDPPHFAPAPMSSERSRTVPPPSAMAAVQNVVRIEDTEENWPVLEHVLRIVDVPQLQVYVEAKIVEVTYTDDLRVGVEAHLKRTLADTFFTGGDMRFPNRLDAFNQATAAFRDVGKYYTFDYLVDLAEAGAKTTIISKPAVFVSQGETATIRVGDSEPIVQQNFTGTAIAATTIFKDTGLRLEVQPLLIGRDAIRARISAEESRVSQFRVTATSADLQVVNPVISTRNTDTVFTVPDGESIAIGGLDRDFDEDDSTGIPLLKDIPLLGIFFGSKTRRNTHTELVFFLTFTIKSPTEARIVKPPSERTRTE
jgi:type II secretory pathway component GspD/PulD (secretin)